MRDPKRIRKMLDLLREYWERSPDLRLGQIIGNNTPVIRNSDRVYIGPGSIYVVEDDIVYESMLKDFLKWYAWDGTGNPKPDQIIFVGPGGDHRGGWATVSEFRGANASVVASVKVKELPSITFTWKYLKEKQEQSRKDYGNQHAHYDHVEL